MTSRVVPSDIRVSSIELFFDLVFVFAITQLTTLLTQDPTIIGLARAVLIFGNVWWMYGGYAWLTNAVPPREPALRLFILVGMAGFLIVALSIPHAFGDSGVAFGVGYLVVTLVHTGMFLRTSEDSALQALGRLGPFNAITAVLLLLAAFTDGALRWTLWSASFALHWITPYFIPVSGFSIRAAHFVERHGLIVLIALGESVVALGMGLVGRDLRAGFILTSVLGLSVAAALWWLYFDGEDERAERALRGADRAQTPWLALYAFGYAFLVILGGIIIFATGGQARHHPFCATCRCARSMVPRSRRRHLCRRIGVVSTIPGYGAGWCSTPGRTFGAVDRIRWPRDFAGSAARGAGRHPRRWRRRRSAFGRPSDYSNEGVREASCEHRAREAGEPLLTHPWQSLDKV
jgi:low temperature requirement protein LtrA